MKNPCLLEAKDCLGRTPARFKETKREKEGKEGGREEGEGREGGEGVVRENRCFSCDLESLGWCAVHDAPRLCGDNANHGTKKWCGDQSGKYSRCLKCSKCKCPGMKNYLGPKKGKQ